MPIVKTKPFVKLERPQGNPFSTERLIEECWLDFTEFSVRMNLSRDQFNRLVIEDRIHPKPARLNSGEWRVHPLAFVTTPVTTVSEGALRKVGGQYEEVSMSTSAKRSANRRRHSVTRIFKVQITPEGELKERVIPVSKPRPKRAKPGRAKPGRKPKPIPESWLPAARRPQPQAPAKTDDGQDPAASESSSSA